MPRKFDFISPGIELTEIDNSVLPPARDNDGPIIIGRTRKGPALKPIKIRSLDDYIAVFGRPNAGGSSPSGDLWRDGAGASAPTYASYAAQAWLAGRTAPVTMVRLLGTQHANPTTGHAGWQLENSAEATVVDATHALNSTAYGLFMVDSSQLGTAGTAALAFGSDAGSVIPYDTQTLLVERNSVVQVTFTFIDADTAKNGTAEKTGANAITIHNFGLTPTQFMALIETAFELAITEGMLSDVSFDNTGLTLNIFNLSTTAGQTIEMTSDGTNNFSLDALALNVERTIAVATKSVGQGALSAVLYCNTGSLGLKGTLTDGSGTGATGQAGSCCFIDSVGANKEFTLEVKNESGTVTNTINFNFNRNSGKYIRKVLNTNPTLTNDNITEASNKQSYWLGESFERFLSTKVTGSGVAQNYGILLPLEDNSDVNWAERREGFAAAESGWVIANNSEAFAGYVAEQQAKMFRVIALQEGDQIQGEIFISVENMNLPPNPEVYAYSTFDIVIRSIDGNALERYSNLSMDENNVNFVARRIGDMYQTWDTDKSRWRMYGDYPNLSDYIRVVMPAVLPAAKDALPFGFLGPGRPKGFGILDGDENLKSFDLSDDFAGAFVKNGDAAQHGSLSGEFAHGGPPAFAVKFEFPKLELRDSGTEGFAANPYQAMYGIRPKISDSSNLHDNDYIDYLRGLPASYRSQLVTPTGNFEHSFTFSLDNLVINTPNVTVVHTSGSHADGSAYTSTNSVQDLLALGVSNWAMPLFGGYDGLDIKEKEPFRTGLMQSSDTKQTNYLKNSFDQAVESIADEEVVPANLLLAPGLRNSHLTNKLIATADSRQDVLAVVDLENDYLPAAEATSTNIGDKAARRGSVKDAIDGLKTRNIDSSFACTFYPWVQITDRLGGSELVWVPSSIAALGAMAKSDSLTDVWFAPAGFNRGGLGSLGGPSGPTVVQARQRLDAKDRDDLYAVGINPIASFPNEGLVVFGQKTLQQRPSALDRINVRRLMLYLKREIGDVAKNTLFQNNVPATWADFKGKAEPILSDVKNRFGLTDYKLILDETTTTPDLIDRNILYAKVFLKPARAIEYIAIDFVITKTGADFV